MSTSSITVRNILIGDVAVLRDIAIGSYSDTFGPHNSLENMQQYFDEAFTETQLLADISQPGSFNYFGCIDGVPAGFIRLRESDEVADTLGNNTIELQRLYILSQFKSKGVGRALMHEALKIARGLQKEWIWLGVWERNFAAQRFYAWFGFERFGEHIFQQGDDPQIDWILKKRL